MSLAYSHISVLVLPVRLSVITNNPVCVCGWSSSDVGGGDLSVQIVVQSLEKTLAQVQVSNRVDALRENN